MFQNFGSRSLSNWGRTFAVSWQLRKDRGWGQARPTQTDPHRYPPLFVFISSTGDLHAERAAAAEALASLEIDGTRFEGWPSTAKPPIQEALERLARSEAIVLILGARYGTRTESGISVTHAEFQRATELSKPVFAYLLDVPSREPDQEAFVREVRKKVFHCRPIGSIDGLKLQIVRSFRDEFTRCFRLVYAMPPVMPAGFRLEVTAPRAGETVEVTLPDGREEAKELLQTLYRNGQDLEIKTLAGEIETRFAADPDLLNYAYMAEVNVAMGGKPADLQRVLRAVTFWSDPEVRQRYQGYSLDYSAGNALGALGRHAEAIERYKLAIGANPAFPQVWKNLGTSYLLAGDRQSGRSCLEEALRLDPQLFEALYSLGTLSLQYEDSPEAALMFLNRIIAAPVPRDRLAGVFGWRAIAYGRLGRYAEGIASAEDALAIAPEAEWAWRTAGRLYVQARQDDPRWLGPAAAFWQRFLEKFPKNAQAWGEAGLVRAELWRTTKDEQYRRHGVDAIIQATSLGFSDGGFLWDRLGHLHQDVGDWSTAEQAYRRAVDEDARKYSYCLGVSLIFLLRYEEALRYLRAAATYQPDGMSWFQLGICEAGLRNIPGAIHAYEHSIKLEPEYAHPYFNLGGLYWNQGDRGRALRIWADAFDRFPDHALANQVRALLGGDPRELMAGA